MAMHGPLAEPGIHRDVKSSLETSQTKISYASTVVIGESSAGVLRLL